MKYCPCGSQKRYLECCGALIVNKKIAPSPEALMRSRYTAYVEGNLDYIRKTMKEEALRNFDKRQAKEKVDWQGLEIVGAEMDTTDPNIGYVEFIARYKSKKEIYQLHEKSRFKKIDDKWFYVDGQKMEND